MVGAAGGVLTTKVKEPVAEQPPVFVAVTVYVVLGAISPVTVGLAIVVLLRFVEGVHKYVSAEVDGLKVNILPLVGLFVFASFAVTLLAVFEGTVTLTKFVEVNPEIPIEDPVAAGIPIVP